MSAAKSFCDLRFYKLARAAAGEIFEASKSFPPEERYSSTDQVRRSSRSTKATISEAWARRRYKAVFIHKIDEALGEASETQSWLDDALDCGYLESGQFEKMDGDWRSISAMLARMIDRASDFCKYSSDTDYWGITMEEPRTWDDEVFGDSDEAPSPLITNHQSPLTSNQSPHTITPGSFFAPRPHLPCQPKHSSLPSTSSF
jgi:four helix bundle protein